jgi:hypothetical protein
MVPRFSSVLVPGGTAVATAFFVLHLFCLQQNIDGTRLRIAERLLEERISIPVALPVYYRPFDEFHDHKFEETTQLLC